MAYETPSLEHVQRAADSSFRIPTPPRIIVPPPRLNNDAVPEISFTPLGKDNGNFVQSNALLEWSYERRREAQMILPYLYLGPIAAAKDGAFLARDKITMVLAIRQKHGLGAKLLVKAMEKVQELGIEYAAVDVGDDQELSKTFAFTTKAIGQHLAQHTDVRGKINGKVLVICESGNERSAAVVAAYLMEAHQDVDFIKAIQLCQAQRFCTNFDDKLKRILQARWTFIEAQRQVNDGVKSEASGSSNELFVNSMPYRASMNGGMDMGNGSGSNQKRSLERDEEDDVMDDQERFGGRLFVPFEDLPSPGSARVDYTNYVASPVATANTSPAHGSYAGASTGADLEME